ncbi:MAG: HipA domain-containing protein [Bilophila wadsworthia]
MVRVSGDRRLIVPDAVASLAAIRLTVSARHDDRHRQDAIRLFLAAKRGSRCRRQPSSRQGRGRLLGVRRSTARTAAACAYRLRAAHASHRYASLDYENLFRLGKSLTRNPEDVEKLVRLMAFNVRLGNQDDHSKNFSFLLDAKGRWRLAPAYDLTPSRGVGGEQTCMVNGKGRDITDKDMIAAASVVDVPARTVKAILEQVGEAVAAPRPSSEVSG